MVFGAFVPDNFAARKPNLNPFGPALGEKSERRCFTGVKAAGPTALNMANSLQRVIIGSFAAILGMFPSNGAHALPPAAPAGQLSLTAWMDIADGDMSGVIVEVNVNGTKDWGRPDADGRVDLLLPRDAVALIHFRKPGHITKSLSVDTHNMSAASFNGRQPKLSIGVKLEPGTGTDELTAAVTTGSIAFDPSSGSLLVEQDARMLRSREQKVVF